MGVIRDIFAGNTAVIDITFVPTPGFPDVTGLTLRIENPLKIEAAASIAQISTNFFKGTYNIPDGGPNGVWIYRWESTASPDLAGEQKFNVVGASVQNP